jgi:uncharacterized protein
MLRLARFALAVLLVPLASGAVLAQSKDKLDETMMSSQAFLDAHPDLKWRQAGLSAWRAGEYEKAFELFKKAARFADKPSQGMVAQLLWTGQGVPQNRAEAYAWMDLAAERSFRPMLIQREIYWESLSEAERKDAIEIGKELYAYYGDEKAQIRTEMAMRRAKKKVAGSRTGFVGNLRITIPTPGGEQTIDGTTYFSEDYWEPKSYWAWQEKGWKNPPRGMVDVGPLTATQAAEPPPGEGKKD